MINLHPGAFHIVSDVAVYSGFLEAGKKVSHTLEEGRGAYLYVVEGEHVEINDKLIPALGAAKAKDERKLRIQAENDAELLLADVLLI